MDGDSGARTGELRLAHGPVATPIFMPVGTAATVKGLRSQRVREIGYSLILANTYHLMLRPGYDVIRKYGSVHQFMDWRANILTDSGGYQVFSLAARRTLDDSGVTFRSHIDGSLHRMTPESTVDLQAGFGSDIQMPLDVCTGPAATLSEATEALAMTNRWARAAHDRWLFHRREGYGGHLFGIVQGNFFEDLRKRAADEIQAIDPPGLAIGGLSVGETFEQFADTLRSTAEVISSSKPRYVMGIGTPEYVLEAIDAGIDMFDCVFPTRAGRTATLFTTAGRLNLRNARFAGLDEPPDTVVDSFGGERYSLGYLHHLFKNGEMLGAILATEHNLRYMKHLVDGARDAIVAGEFSAYKKHALEPYTRQDASVDDA